jgi:hypothetical protein
LDNVNVTENQEIARADLSKLTYTPNARFHETDSFGWNGSDGALYAAAGASVNITVRSGVLFTLTPTYNNDGSVTLTYKLANGTTQTLSSIVVTGNLTVAGGGVIFSTGDVLAKINNPRTGGRTITWNNFSLAPGDEATLTVTMPYPPRKTALTSNWTASWGGKNKGSVTAPAFVTR